MAIFALTYDYADDSDAARDQFRPEHREFLRELAAAGQVLVSGPYTDDGAPGALLIVQADDVEAAAALLSDDPFQREGLVARSTFRVWNPVLGPLAEHFA